LGTDLIARAVVSIDGLCTGTLMNSTWVITAKHCVADASGIVSRNFVIHHFPTGTDVTVPTANVFIHPDLTMDVALLHLPSPISTGQGPISLFQGEDADVVNKSVTTYGFGLLGYITNGCANGASCPVNAFCDGNNGCVSYAQLLNIDCPAKACPTGYSCDFANGASGHCAVNRKGTSGALLKATFTVQKVVRDNSMQNSPVYNGKYLSLPMNASGQTISSGDSGGPTFINGQIVGITGGGTWVTYAKVFRNWVRGMMSPSTNNGVSPSGVGFFVNMVPPGTNLRTGDVNGDGYTDLVQFNQNSLPAGSVYVVLGSPSGYTTMTRWHTNFSVGAQWPEVGDVDGDGKADIITFDQSTGQVFVAISNGVSQFGASTQWHGSFSFSGEIPRVADMNGDGRADVVTFVQVNNWGAVWVSMSCGTDANHFPQGCSAGARFGTRINWANGFSLTGEVPRVADVNGDGLADIVTFSTDTNAYVSLTRRHACTSSADCSFGPCDTALGICPATLGEAAGAKTFWGTGFFVTLGETPMMADVNGDGFVDAVDFETVTSSRNGFFGVTLSNGASLGPYTLWGTSVCHRGEVCAVGDANRDGKSDAFNFIPGALDSYYLSNP
jgi:hypothetical protein